MKALTLHQPWASLVAAGAKTIETRSWPTKYRGRLAIHAAKTEKPVRTFEGRLLARELRRRAPDSVEIPFGVVVAVVELVDVRPIEVFDHPSMLDRAQMPEEGGMWEPVPPDQIPYGDFRSGRYAWILDEISPLPNAIPVRGAQGLWRWTP